MKKTISINIGGIIFHIEEDGYEKLKSYLGSIQRYFSSFADSKEILSDIEGRIAERFLARQKADNKQAISLEDVEELIAAMGTVADFEAIEQAEDLLTEPLQAATPGSSSTGYQPPVSSFDPASEKKTATPNPRRLFRDMQRKLIGGVASGLAHYFTIDPLWVRLLFLFFVIGLPASSGIFDAEDVFGPLSGIVVILYIAMWVAFPGSVTLEEDKSIKKFFRDPDRKVVGGVAAGVASYFGVDVGVVRFLWVLSIFFFGTGFLIYIILWIIAPAANTLTEKMEMQGEPITLTNIESNIKRGLNLEETASGEPPLTRLLLFPFRAIAIIISGLGKLLKGIGPILRVIIGALLIASAVASLLGILIGGGVGLGMRNMLPFGEIPPLLLLQEAPSTLILSIVLLVTIPFIVILLLGLTLIANRRVASGTLWLTLAGLWVVGIIGAAISGGVYQQKFSKRGEIQQVDLFPWIGTPILDEYDNDESNDFDWNIRMVIEGYTGDSIKIEREITSRGSSTQDARSNAMDMTYRVVQKDSVIRFDEEPTLNSDGRFRNQRVNMRLLMPYDRPFIISPEFFYGKFTDWRTRDKYREMFDDQEGTDWRQLRWAIKADSGLVCLNMPAKYLKSLEENTESEEDDSYEESENNEIGSLNLGERGEHVRQFSANNFQRIEVGGAYAIEIRKGNDFSVAADGKREDVESLEVYVKNGTLHVEKPGEFNFFKDRSKRIGLVITMPTLRGVQLSGATQSRISGFESLDRLDVDLSGATISEIDVKTNQLDLSLTGASSARLRGSARTADFALTGACELNAKAMTIDEADVDATGASRAVLGKVRSIRKMTTGASRIDTEQ
ncbi:PspC domain-containing protein [Arundinibacter roseus]|uniref:PspC domain-containing protein n=1 Tax=Arundinibacter roseus TaxID=2070510 RepID=A0A4R4KBR0_9BACT|nr:PspC domain-containing protein [Arundinibacter roseus]TDB64136.1 PspC domain-containing protein [Arundinibacter roseus]